MTEKTLQIIIISFFLKFYKLLIGFISENLNPSALHKQKKIHTIKRVTLLYFFIQSKNSKNLHFLQPIFPTLLDHFVPLSSLFSPQHVKYDLGKQRKMFRFLITAWTCRKKEL